MYTKVIIHYYSTVEGCRVSGNVYSLRGESEITGTERTRK